MCFRVLLALVVLLPTLLTAFKAYWNFPSKECQTNHYIDFSRYKIEANSGLEFYGDKVVIFYESIFGRYPYYKDYDENQPVNGGTPQNCSLNDHLNMTEKHIETRIPETNFDGLAVIDLEEWRPLFNQNFWGKKEVYRNQSIALARLNSSGITDDKEIEKIAKKQFEYAARMFFVETIRLGRKLREHAKWGFYGFPYCNYDAGRNGKYECDQKYQDWNDEMMFIFNESTALYPSIYLGSFNATSNEAFRYVQAILKESRRIAKKFTPPLPIYAYTKIEYDPLKKIDHFYDEHDLCSTIKQPADLGIDGIIFWSSSRNMTSRCPHIKRSMESVIGSKVKETIDQHETCRKSRCMGHGRCVFSSNITCPFVPISTDAYQCECDQGFSGDFCDISPTSTNTI